MLKMKFSPRQRQFHQRHNHQAGGGKTNQHQGSATGSVHNPQTFSGNGGWRAGSDGEAPTSPRYSVLRLNFKFAARASVPSAETATAGRSYLPSGSAKR